MTSVEEKERIHTYLDDIKFQSVKNNRRTSFVSIDHQIVAKNAQAMRDIEKRKQLTTADYRRQEKTYLQKLEKLHQVKGISRRLSDETSNKNFSSERRHSAPTVFWAHLSESQQRAPSSIMTRTNTNLQRQTTDYIIRSQSLEPSSSFNQNDINNNNDNNESKQYINTTGLPSTPSVNNNVMLARLPYNGRPSPEARRMSYDLQQETSKAALQKLDLIVKNQKRRATIAEGIQSGNIFSLLGANSDSVLRSTSIAEDECFD